MSPFYLLLAIALVGAAPEGGGSLTADQLHQLLKARDSQFDNVCLHYSSSASVERRPRTRFDAYKAGDRSHAAKLVPVAEQVPTVIDFKYDELMTVRGKDVTFDRTIVRSSLKSGDSSIQMLPHQKWSNCGDDLKELTDDGTKAKISKILEYRPKNVPVSVTDEQRMEVEFAFGFGFGSRIKSIDSLRLQDGAYEASGTIQVWWADVSTFRIRLDKDFIVRHAEIDSDVAGNLTRFEVDSTGTAGDRFLVAKSGHFLRKWMGRRNAGVVEGEPEIKKEFTVEYQSAEWDLTDVAYANLVSIESDENTQVIDHTGNHAPSFVNGMAAKREGSFTVIIANVIAGCVVLAIWLFRKTFQRPKAPG